MPQDDGGIWLNQTTQDQHHQFLPIQTILHLQIQPRHRQKHSQGVVFAGRFEYALTAITSSLISMEALQIQNERGYLLKMHELCILDKLLTALSRRDISSIQEMFNKEYMYN
jgi:hypothetical protein